MYPFYLELELIKPVSDYFKNQGYKIKHEIRIGYCRADLVGFKNDEVVAVELKLRDWKKALMQAKNYQLASDKVFIAVPLERLYDILRKAEHIFKKEKIGLLVIKENNCDVNEIIKAGKSPRKISNITISEINRNYRRNLNKRRYYKK